MPFTTWTLTLPQFLHLLTHPLPSLTLPSLPLTIPPLPFPNSHLILSLPSSFLFLPDSFLTFPSHSPSSSFHFFIFSPFFSSSYVLSLTLAHINSMLTPLHSPCRVSFTSARLSSLLHLTVFIIIPCPPSLLPSRCLLLTLTPSTKFN